MHLAQGLALPWPTASNDWSKQGIRAQPSCPNSDNPAKNIQVPNHRSPPSCFSAPSCFSLCPCLHVVDPSKPLACLSPSTYWYHHPHFPHRKLRLRDVKCLAQDCRGKCQVSICLEKKEARVPYWLGLGGGRSQTPGKDSPVHRPVLEQGGTYSICLSLPIPQIRKLSSETEQDVI